MRPSDVFKACPECESPNLLHFEGDSFCLYCTWDSVILREDARFEAQYGNNREPNFEDPWEQEDRDAKQAKKLLEGELNFDEAFQSDLDVA